jgi:hypothetical protein
MTLLCVVGRLVSCNTFLWWLDRLSNILRGSAPTFSCPTLFLLLFVGFHCQYDNTCCKFYLQHFRHDWGLMTVTVHTGHSLQSHLASTCLWTEVLSSYVYVDLFEQFIWANYYTSFMHMDMYLTLFYAYMHVCMYVECSEFASVWVMLRYSVVSLHNVKGVLFRFCCGPLHIVCKESTHNWVALFQWWYSHETETARGRLQPRVYTVLSEAGWVELLQSRCVQVQKARCGKKWHRWCCVLPVSIF